MVRRESMTTQAGQDWVDGNLDAEEYFREAREKARLEAQRVIDERLSAAQVAAPPRQLGGHQNPVPR